MSTYQFKTNMQCSGCVEKVTPYLNGIKAIDKWSVDVTQPQKILIVTGPDGLESEIMSAVQEAGYKIEPVV